MTTLGIDYGSVHVGLAVSDSEGILAMPLEAVNLNQSLDRIAHLVKEKGIQLIVLGMPRNMDGSYGPKSEEVKKFAELLKKKCAVAIRFWDERLTTRSVERMLIEADVSRKKRKEVVDQLAAHLILQNFLDAQAELNAPAPEDN